MFDGIFKFAGLAVICVTIIALAFVCFGDTSQVENTDAVADLEQETFGSYVLIDMVVYDHGCSYELTMYDPDTYVMYRYTKGTGYEFFTELWNTDGTIQIYYEAMNAVG